MTATKVQSPRTHEKPKFGDYGFPYPDRVICAFRGGSELHGAKLKGTDDTDYYGVFIEPAEKSLGIDRFEHFVHSTGDPKAKNTSEDVDICLYSLRKWAGLAAKGNPSVLHFLFAPSFIYAEEWQEVLHNKSIFLARSHLDAFLGYANSQMHRLLIGKPKDVSRPFLEEQYGFDTKYAMHMVRLFHEARELMETGGITLPRPEAQELIEIRKGKYQIHELTKIADELGRMAIEARKTSCLPEKVDRAKVSSLIARLYGHFYNKRHRDWVEP